MSNVLYDYFYKYLLDKYLEDTGLLTTLPPDPGPWPVMCEYPKLPAEIRFTVYLGEASEDP